MAQGTILAAGTTTATSSNVTLASGATATFAMAVASGSVPRDAIVDVVLVATGFADVPIGRLTGGTNAVQATGPGVFRAIRRTAGKAGTPVAVVADPNV